ncbi:hypothetical protein TNCV_3682631 [Trichonephila clavipes]|uniref:Uncharacterized protein n=1 Tax=Trichonephila clavipes TaxID=2585209 RepID=A0A8X6RLX4_TRICX|nr:hypothetical protein TNCV_3682631 [Trichonephila clavipes]
MSDRGSRNSSRQRVKYMSAVIRIFEHHTGDGTIWLGSTLIMRENKYPGGGQGLLISLFSFHQPHEKTCGSTAT